MKKIIFEILFLFLCVYCVKPQPWSLQNSGTTNQLNSISASRNNYAWVCGNNGTVLRTTNGGNNWLNVSGNGLPSSLNLFNIFSNKSYSFYIEEFNYAYVTGTDSSGSYLYKTSNGGLNWSKILTFTGAGARINAISFFDTATGFVEGEPVSGRWSLWKTTNRGLTWDSSGLFLNGQNYAGFSNNLAGKITPYLDSSLYIGAIFNNSETHIFRSTNLGINWNLLVPGITKPMTGICFINPMKGLIGGNNYIYSTTDFGNNWVLDSILPFTPTLVASTFNSGTNVNFYLKTDSAGTQSIYVKGTSNYWSLDFSGIKGMRHMQGMDYTIWVVGDSGRIYSRGIYYPYIRKINAEIPDRFLLYQNYPNPFNPMTKIKFNIAENTVGQTFLSVYDINGRKIQTLVNEQLQSGTYEVTFDGSNLASGIYFYRLETPDFTQTNKMILIK